MNTPKISERRRDGIWALSYYKDGIQKRKPPKASCIMSGFS